MRFRKSKPPTEREAMIARLQELRREANRSAAVSKSEYERAAGKSAYRTYDDYLLYATVGKDRKKLGMEWAERAQESVAQMDRLLASMMGGRSS